MPTGWKNKLYFGDNLVILREHVEKESVDLVYLDPPFNSNASYNVLFGQHKGDEAGAQITAFEDTWHWGIEAEGAFKELVDAAPPRLVDLMRALRAFLGQSDMMAYLCMMAIRLVELHRVLKPTGSLYLHCDPTASHYLKLVMDTVFGSDHYVSEIIWQRTSAHGNASRKPAAVHDVLLLYSKGNASTWNAQFTKYSDEYIAEHFVHVDPDGRRFRRCDLRNPGVRPNLRYEYKASDGRVYKPHPNGWAVSLEVMQELDKQGRLFFPAKDGGRLRKKLYLDESPGVPLTDVWSDLPPIHASAAERLGYPTQKPEALLERIIKASSNEGDLVLDPFCGCGTTVVAAERLKRRWIGIDITHLAITLMVKRLKDSFQYSLSDFEVEGVPKDLASARELAQGDRYQFEWWAVALVGARHAHDKKRGADTGVDGVGYFHDDQSGQPKKVVVQVKSGHVKSGDIRDFSHVIAREKAAVGLFLTLEEPSAPMVREAAVAGFFESDFFKGERKFPRLQILTVEELLGGKRPDLPSEASSRPATFKEAPRKEPNEKGQRKLF